MKALAIGPMSEEIIEGVFRYSHLSHIPLMLIASKNQIDHSGGYVENWNTIQYMSYVKKLKHKYTDANVLICRDHCGPGFNKIKNNLTDTFKTIETDVRAGFDLIHIDFCHFQGPKSQALEKAVEAIKYAKRLNPFIKFEIGTDEINQPVNLNNLRKEIEHFLPHCTPDYYVVNTGSHVLEDTQVGIFNRDKSLLAKQLLNDYNLKLKEHNADYLTPSQIQERENIVDAQNIAPELGVRQTERVLSLANQHRIDTEAFIKVAYESKKWRKWLNLSSPDDIEICATLAGHYVFSSKEYKLLVKHLDNHLDIKEDLIQTAMEVIDRYVRN